jgi:hypothetical protein
LCREPSVGVKRGVEGCWEGMVTRNGEEGVGGDGDVFWILEERECSSSGSLWLRGGGRGGLKGIWGVHGGGRTPVGGRYMSKGLLGTVSSWEL